MLKFQTEINDILVLAEIGIVPAECLFISMVTDEDNNEHMGGNRTQNFITIMRLV